jgi:hypothetical protein
MAARQFAVCPRAARMRRVETPNFLIPARGSGVSSHSPFGSREFERPIRINRATETNGPHGA